MKQMSEEKDATKKKIIGKKNAAVTGIWPCKIDGCTKQFSREADLKRHQRTTRLHSVPRFACPQCDATFTRTDALRRHQKSRHSGVVVEPSDSSQKDFDESPMSHGSNSRSRSLTPSGKSKRHPNPIPSSSLGQIGPLTGHSSYYRQHTVTTSPYIPHHAPYPPGISLPTSATRLHQANWLPPWEGNPPQPVSDTSPGYYQTTYYRPNGSPSSSHSQALHPHIRDGGQDLRNGVPVGDHALSHDEISPSVEGDPSINLKTHSPLEKVPVAPVIDPSLEASIDSSPKRPGVSIEVTQAAMQALLTSAASTTGVSSPRGSNSPVGNLGYPSSHSGGDAVANTGFDMEQDRDAGKTDDSVGVDRDTSMEHVLTEDGEPMLNPAELLTSESLASPPPS